MGGSAPEAPDAEPVRAWWPELSSAAGARLVRAPGAACGQVDNVQWRSMDDLLLGEEAWSGLIERRAARAEALLPEWRARFARACAEDGEDGGGRGAELLDEFQGDGPFDAAYCALMTAVRFYQRRICWHVRVGRTAAAVAGALSDRAIGHVLEVGCGRQCLGMFVMRALPRLAWTFCDVVAHSSPVLGHANAVLVESGDVAAAESEAEALVLCWPGYEDPMAVRALRAFRGGLLVYMGEGRGGCTADDAFFEELRGGWTLLYEDREAGGGVIPGLDDAWQLYERRGAPGAPAARARAPPRGKKGPRRRWKKK